MAECLVAIFVASLLALAISPLIRTVLLSEHESLRNAKVVGETWQVMSTIQTYGSMAKPLDNIFPTSKYRFIYLHNGDSHALEAYNDIFYLDLADGQMQPVIEGGKGTDSSPLWCEGDNSIDKMFTCEGNGFITYRFSWHYDDGSFAVRSAFYPRALFYRMGESYVFR